MSEFDVYYEVVSVSKENNEVVFRSSEWFDESETLDRIEVGTAGLEIVQLSKVERSRKITVKTNENFKVGQKFSYFEFHRLSLLFTSTKYGTFRKTGKTVGGTIENRILNCDSDYGWESKKIENDDVNNLISFLNKMSKSAK